MAERERREGVAVDSPKRWWETARGRRLTELFTEELRRQQIEDEMREREGNNAA